MISHSVLIPAIVTADDSSLLEDPRKALRLSSRLLVLVRYVIEWDNGQLQGFFYQKGTVSNIIYCQVWYLCVQTDPGTGEEFGPEGGTRLPFWPSI